MQTKYPSQTAYSIAIMHRGKAITIVGDDIASIHSIVGKRRRTPAHHVHITLGPRVSDGPFKVIEVATPKPTLRDKILKILKLI